MLPNETPPQAPASPQSESAQSASPAPVQTSPVVPPVARPARGILMVALALVAVIAGGSLFWSGYALGQRTALQPGTPASDDEAFQPFWDAYRAVVDRYAGGPVDKEALIEGAIKGMVGALEDPYSTYMSPKDYKQALQDLSGQFEGIGAEIGTRKPDGAATDCSTLGADCRLTVIAPIAGSPAEKAGVQAGDQVIAVDGSGLDGLTVDGARDKIRGPKGTQVKLTIVRNGGAPFELTITRDVIVSREVTTRTLANGAIGYIRLAGFSEGGADEVVAAIRESLDAGRTRLILDLRGNPGGFVDAARKVASQFIKDGPIFWQEDSSGTQTPTQALGDGIATDPSIRVVVLIDKGSASASEIVAGALQDTGRARLVGDTSYGKGTVQQWTDLGSGGGGLKLTIAKWLTPDKRWINHTGLTPDVKVTVPDGSPAGSDPVLDTAVRLLTDGTASLGVATVLQRAA